MKASHTPEDPKLAKSAVKASPDFAVVADPPAKAAKGSALAELPPNGSSDFDLVLLPPNGSLPPPNGSEPNPTKRSM